MRALRLLAASSLAVAFTVLAPSALAAACALSAGSLGIGVGDGETVILVNDGTTVDVVGVGSCSTAIASITAGIFVSGTSGDNGVEIRLHATVPYPNITFALSGGTDSVLVTGSPSGDSLNVPSRFSGAGSVTTFTIDGGGGDDTINALGWNAPVRLLGGSGEDMLTGTVYADTIDGGPNDDTISGRGGADELEGGLGEDLADYATSPAAVTVTVNAGNGNSGGDAAGDSLSGLEGIIGSPLSDILTGGPAGDTLLGNAGDDLLAGRGGADLLGGGSGVDTATYLASLNAVRVSLGLGATGGDATGDQLVGVENLIGSAFGDRLTGDGLANRLAGGGGNDTIIAGAGNDTVSGGPGNDLLDGGVGSDTVTFEGTRRQVAVNLSTGRATGDGTDTLKGLENVTGGSKPDAITGDARANILSGGGGADSIDGSGGNDRLLGGSGSDQLLGGPGADFLDGGTGRDSCDGGPDLDTYKACDGTGKP